MLVRSNEKVIYLRDTKYTIAILAPLFDLFLFSFLGLALITIGHSN